MSTMPKKGDCSKLFLGKAHSEVYQLSRPTYPNCMYEAIFQYLQGDGTRQEKYTLAVDIGCGSGQATQALAAHFSKIIGIDISETQIQQANLKNTCGNIEYRISPGEDLSFCEDESVDLVTCAASFHWLNQEKVFREVQRVLRKGGVLAIYCYGSPILENEEASKVLQQFFDETCKPYMAPEIFIAFNRYTSIHPPLRDIQRLEDFKIEVSKPLSAFMKFMESFSFYQTLVSADPTSTVLADLSTSLRSILAPAQESSDPIVDLHHPAFMVLGRK